MSIITLLALECVSFAWTLSNGPCQESDVFLNVRDVALVVICLLNGGFRCSAFHPIFHSEYREWLRHTPWERSIRLPMGTLHPTWADVLVVFSLASFLWFDTRPFAVMQSTRFSGWWAVVAWMMGHTGISITACWLAGARRWSYASSTLLALSIRIYLELPVASLVLCTSAFLVANYGLYCSFESFPWEDPYKWLKRLKAGWMAQTQQANVIEDTSELDLGETSQIGWPFEVLSPHVTPDMTSKPERVFIATLVGLWINAVLHCLPDGIVPGAWLFFLMGGFGACTAWAVLFGRNHQSPMNGWGRFCTFRWIIFRYDRPFIFTILLIVTLVGLSAIFGVWLRLDHEVAIPLVATLVLWTTFILAPDPLEWQLTAPARIVPAKQNNRNYEELTG